VARTSVTATGYLGDCVRRRARSSTSRVSEVTRNGSAWHLHLPGFGLRKDLPLQVLGRLGIARQRCSMRADRLPVWAQRRQGNKHVDDSMIGGCRHGSRQPGRSQHSLSQIRWHYSLGNCIRNLAEGEGFEPPKACTLVVFKATFNPSATVRGRSPTSAPYFTPSRFVR